MRVWAKIAGPPSFRIAGTRTILTRPQIIKPKIEPIIIYDTLSNYMTILIKFVEKVMTFSDQPSHGFSCHALDYGQKHLD